MDDPPTRPSQGPGAQPTSEPSAIPGDPSISGPLDRPTALSALARADELLEAGEFAAAGALYQRVIGFPDAAVTAAALFGLGNALYRLDAEDDALQAWQRVLDLPETPSTYPAWRQIAAQRVRNGDLSGAQKAYEEASRRAPAADRAEIASRLGWLAKETGDARGAARHFRQSRGGLVTPIATYAIIAITVIVSITAFSSIDARTGGPLDPSFDPYGLLQLDKIAVARGEYWRLLTVTLLHAPPDFGYLHLASNMYALFLAGPLVERIYGRPRFLVMYLVTAAAASTASFVFGGDAPSVGASGAVFGLFGVLVAVSRFHHPMLDRRGRALIGQVGTLVVFNLVLGFGAAGGGIPIDNSAHIGGLIAGLWLGFLMAPTDVRTTSNDAGAPAPRALVRSPLLQVLGVAVLLVVIAVGLSVGTAQRLGRPVAGLIVATPSALVSA